MPTRKKRGVRHKMIDEVTENLVPTTMETAPPVKKPMLPHAKVVYFILAILILSALLLANKSLLVAAVVDGQPIWRWQLNKVLTQRFGDQTLEGMISEILIANEAKKAGVTVAPADVTLKETEIVKGLGPNVNIDDLLKYQGITKTDFDNQIKLQLTVQKILGKDIEITDSDVNNYIATNRATLTASGDAELKAEARQAILDNKVNEKVQPWFADLKAKAKILKFL